MSIQIEIKKKKRLKKIVSQITRFSDGDLSMFGPRIQTPRDSVDLIWDGLRILGEKLKKERDKVAKHKLSIKNFEELTNRYNFIFENASDAIYILNPKTFEFLDCNVKARTMLGYNREEFLGLKVTDVFGSTEPEVLARYMQEIKEEEVYYTHTNAGRKDKTTLQVELTCRSVKINNRWVVQIIAKDVTVQEKIGRELAVSQERLMEILDNVNQIIYTKKADANCEFQLEYVSRNVQSILGYTSEEYLGLSYKRRASEHHPEDVPKINRKIKLLKKTLKPVVIVYRHKHRVTREYVWLEDRVVPKMSRAGKLIGVFGSASDVTRRVVDQEERDKFRHTIDLSAEAIYITDPRNLGQILDVNKAACTQLGYTRKALLKMRIADIQVGYALQTAEQWEELIERCANAVSKPVMVEGAHRRKDGSRFPVEVSIEMKKVGNVLYSFGVVRDISDRKRWESNILKSLEEKEVLIKEVHHRVKNNMQVISSLLYLQSEAIKDEESSARFAECQHQIKSMALVHEKLYQSDSLGTVNMEDYINNLMQYLIRSYGFEFGKVVYKVQCNDIQLGIKQAVPCGLIINELVTNALKFGFPEGREGTIYVSIRTLKKKYRLEVSNDGVDFPKGVNIEQPRSLGLRLISSLARQLKGELVLDRKGGVTFKIEFIK